MKGLILQMKKSFKFVLIFISLFIISFSPVYAVGIDMNLNTDIENSINIVDNNNTVTQESINTTPKYSTSNTSEDFILTVSDIINIILISVGIVLIFLAIAILIRIK